MHACMYACMHACGMHVCMFATMYACMHDCMCVSVYLCVATCPDMTHSTSITDVIHIPDPKHGSDIRANLDTVRASVLRVCVALSQPPTWGVTLVPEATPVQGFNTDTHNRANTRGTHSGYPSRRPCLWLPKSTPGTGFVSKVETALVC
jgi:hypothetical protein